MKRKQIELFFQKIDVFLSNFNHVLLSWFILSLIYYFLLYGDTKRVIYESVVVSVIIALFTIWYYRSTRKYGFIETTVFCTVFPFVFIAALIPLLSQDHSARQKVKKDYSGLVNSFSIYLESSINEIYSGKVVDKHWDDEGAYITLEAPYGISIHSDELVNQVSKDIHISRTNIGSFALTNSKTQFVIMPKGLKEYDAYSAINSPWNTLPEIRDRILLKTKMPRVIRISHSESV